MAHHNSGAHSSHGHGGHGLSALGVFLFARNPFAPLILLLLWGALLWGH
jgi:hypothetical protein